MLTLARPRVNSWITSRNLMNLLTRCKVSTEASCETKFELYKLDKGPASSTTLTADDALSAFKAMHYIRRVETKAAELYMQKMINGFLHLYNGQEAICVGMKMCMKDVDTVITAYRCHGFAASFGATAREIMAELLGRKTGNVKGRGGSMHMYRPQFYGGEGIVGGQAPVGTGLALAHKYNGTGGVSFTLYGDGAASQGQLFESYNLSLLWGLPVVYICENNHYGMGTPQHRHSANIKFYTRGDLIPGIKVNGMKLWDVKAAINFAREYAVKSGPIILEMDTYRYYGHSMSDPGVSYRTREEVQKMRGESDPIVLLHNLMVEKELKTDSELKTIRTTIIANVDKEIEQAKADPFPDLSMIPTEIYKKPLEKVRGKAPWEIL